MNTLKNLGIRFAGGIVALGLVSSAFAGMDSIATVNLPEGAALGSAVLPGGQYRITATSMTDGDKLFVFRSDNGAAFTALATRNAPAPADQKSEMILSENGGKLHVDQMFIAGESAGYQFDVSR